MYERFEALLKKHGITAYRVSKETGISTATLTQWKNGSSVPKADKLQKIADYFGVSIEYLMGKTEKQKSDELSGIYFSIAKEFQDNNIDPDDIKKALELIKQLRNK